MTSTVSTEPPARASLSGWYIVSSGGLMTVRLGSSVGLGSTDGPAYQRCPFYVEPQWTTPDEVEEVSREPEQARIIAALRSSGQDEVAERIEALIKMIRDDPDEPRIITESLRCFAAYMLINSHLDTPTVGTDPRGQVQATWRPTPQGLVVMAFQPDHRVRYSGASGPAVPGVPRTRVSGLAYREDVLGELQGLLAR